MLHSQVKQITGRTIFSLVLRFPVIGDIFVGIVRSGLLDKTIAKLTMGKAWRIISLREKREISRIISQDNKTASQIAWYHIARSIKTSKDFVKEAKNIQVPVLCLYGGLSELRKFCEINVEFFKKYLPQIELIEIKEGIHDIQLQKPREVAKIIQDFLSSKKKS